MNGCDWQISGNFTADGQTLNATAGWDLDVTGTAVAVGDGTVAYCTAGGTEVEAGWFTDNGNNTNWNFDLIPDNVEFVPYYLYENAGNTPIAIENGTDLDTIHHTTLTPAAQYDWSGVAVDNASGTRRKSLGALVTPKHMIVAAHNGNAGVRTWIDSGNNKLTRTASVAGDVGLDIRVLVLDSELPATCKVYPVLTEMQRLDGVGLLCVEQDIDVELRRYLYNEATGNHYHQLTWQQETIAASGNPAFIALSGALCLAFTHTYATQSYSAGDFVDEINAILDDAGAYSLVTQDAPTGYARVDTTSPLPNIPMPAYGAM